MGGDVHKLGHAKGGGRGKAGDTFFSGLLGGNFFQLKKDKAEAALQLTETNVRQR